MDLSKVDIGAGDTSVEATLLFMKQLILKSDMEDKERLIKETAKNIVKDIPSSDHYGQIKAITRWVRLNLKYARDIYGVEELTSPYRIIYNILNGRNTHSSDCDDFAILLAALLRALGFRTRLEAIAVQTQNYNHARMAVYIGGSWVVIEGTKPQYPVGQALPSTMPILAVEVI